MADPVKHILWTIKAMLPEIIEEQRKDPRDKLLAHILGRVEGEVLSLMNKMYGYKETCNILGIKGIVLTDTSLDMTEKEWTKIATEVSKVNSETILNLCRVLDLREGSNI